MKDLQRFFQKTRLDEETGCLVWTASRSGQLKYGYFWGDGRGRMAHRWLYERIVGAVPLGKELDHLCRNPPCVNLAHLEVVTPRENVLRGQTVTGDNARKTRCPQGHPYDLFNTRIRPNGWRECQTCEAARKQQARAEHRW